MAKGKGRGGRGGRQADGNRRHGVIARFPPITLDAEGIAQARKLLIRAVANRAVEMLRKEETDRYGK